MRRSVTDQAAAAPDFVLDDQFFGDTPPAAAESLVFGLADNKEADGVSDTAAPLNKWRNVSFPWRLLGILLLIAGLVVFVLQGRHLDAVVDWLRTPRDSAAPTKATAGGTDAATAAAPVTRAERAVIPPKPKPTLKRAAPAAKPVLPPPTQAREEDSWFSLAEEYLQMGDVARAEAIYLRFSREGAQRGRASLALGDIYFKKGDSQRAQEYYLQSKQQFREDGSETSQP